MINSKPLSMHLRACLVAFLAIGLGAFGAAAQADVELQNTVKKVETYVDEQGDVKRRLVDAAKVVPGDELQYMVRFTNSGEQVVDAGTIVITDAIPAHTQYIDGTAFGAGTDVKFSVDGSDFAQASDLVLQADGDATVAQAQDYKSIRWTFAPGLKPGQAGYVSFNVRLL